jgi:hypothetical protein
MLKEHASVRNFKGGSWDLRKDNRRKSQLSITFPDRRSEDRRGVVSQADERAMLVDSLTWVSKSALDE